MLPVNFVGNDNQIKYGCNTLGSLQRIVNLEPSTEYNPFEYKIVYSLTPKESCTFKEKIKAIWMVLKNNLVITEHYQ